MSGGLAVRTLDRAGGQQLAGGQNLVRIAGEPVVVLGDPVQPHGDAPHDAPQMVEGLAWMRIQGSPVCRDGHMASCGHPTTGRTWIRAS